MKRSLSGILLLSLAVAPGFATALFQGSLATDNQVALFNITANAPEAIAIETYSYSSGTVNATPIPAGGFAPTAFLFDRAQVGRHPTTGNCDVIYFQDTLQPGTYTLASSTYNNTPADTSVADEFVEDGDPGLTCVEARTSGSFCDLTTALGTSRTGAYAISITGVDSATQLGVPEPGSIGSCFWQAAR